MSSFEPKIIAFLCNWCSYTGADLAGTSRMDIPHNVEVIRVMCSSRVDPVMVLKALMDGADGVLIGGCHPGDCHYIRGNYYTRRRVAMLRNVFRVLGLEEQRIRLEWISASEGSKFSSVTNEFVEKIRSMGPSPFRIISEPDSHQKE